MSFVYRVLQHKLIFLQLLGFNISTKRKKDEKTSLHTTKEDITEKKKIASRTLEGLSKTGETPWGQPKTAKWRWL